MLDHPTDPRLRGPITFKLPDVFTSISIQRRITELANAGRDPKRPALHPTDLTQVGFELCVMVATLEHVIETAPAGLYVEVAGRANLMPGRLTEFEGEDATGVIQQLYAAYMVWRSLHRRRRDGEAQGIDQDAASADGGIRGEASGAKSTQGAGRAGESTDDAGRGAADARTDEPPQG